MGQFFKKFIRELISFALTFVVVFVVIKGFYAYVAEPFKVDGASMEYSLHDGDQMFMNKLAETDRFDVIIFPSPRGVDEDGNIPLYVKRVIGMPGDTIEFQNGQLILNGVSLEEPYIQEMQATRSTQITRDFTLEQVTGETVVHEGKLFVIGDNRQNSTDGRSFGFINADEVIGEAIFVWWPFENIRTMPNYQLNEAGTEIITK